MYVIHVYSWRILTYRTIIILHTTLNSKSLHQILRNFDKEGDLAVLLIK